MALKISKAMAKFDLAEFVDLDCGDFELRITQAAIHNEEFRTNVSKRALAAKRKSVVPDLGTMTGSYEEDVKLFVDLIIKGWGQKKPLKDDDGNVIPYSKAVAMELFGIGDGIDEKLRRQGKVLFGKVMQAAIDDKMFALSEDDTKNS